MSHTFYDVYTDKTITFVLKVSAYIIMKTGPIGLAAILAIMSVSSFMSAAMLYMSIKSKIGNLG